MKKILIIFALFFISFSTYADEWISQRPSICALTSVMFKDLKEGEYILVAKSRLVLGTEKKQVGETWFFAKNDEFLILDNFYETNTTKAISCIISVTLDFTKYIDTKKEF